MLRKWIRRWLGIEALHHRVTESQHQNSKLLTNLVEIGVDVHQHSNSTIVITSDLHGGQVRIISAHFKNFKELRDEIHRLQEIYNTTRVRADQPMGAEILMIKEQMQCSVCGAIEIHAAVSLTAEEATEIVARWKDGDQSLGTREDR